MNKLVILREEETNAYYDPNKAGNGGGYHQPQYDFQYGAWYGTFHDTSCGDFGTRYGLIISDGEREYRAGWGTMYDEWESTFPEQFPDSNFYKDFKETFDEKIPTKNEE